MERDTGLNGFDHERAENNETVKADFLSPTGQAPSAGSAGAASFGVDIAASGVNEVLVRFANGWGEARSVAIHVDGASPLNASFPATGGWSSFETIALQLDLAAGHHVLSFAALNGSGPLIQEVTVNEAFAATGVSMSTGGLISAINLAAIAGLALTTRVADGGTLADPAETDEAAAGSGPQADTNADAEAGETLVAQGGTGNGETPAAPEGEQIIEQGSGNDPAMPVGESLFGMLAAQPPLDGVSALGTPAYTRGDAVNLSSPTPVGQENLQPMMMAAAAVVDPDFPTSGQILIQAESAVLSLADTDANANDTTIRTPRNKEDNASLPTGLRPGFSGSGYLDFGDTPGDAAVYSFTLSDAGTYTFHIRYASNGARPLAFSIDGTTNTLPFPTTDPDGNGSQEGFDNWQVQIYTVTLEAGTHTFSLAIPAGFASGPNIDAIAITAEGGTPDFSAGNSLPVTDDDSFTVEEGTLAVGTVTAEDADGDLVDFALTDNDGTDNALFTIDPATGAISFNAAPDFEVPGDADGDNVYTIEVQMNDGTGTVLKTITVSVTNDPSDDVPGETNTAPAAADLAAEMDEDGTLTIDLAGSISDADGDALTVTGATSANGTVTISGTNLVFTPAANFNGPATIDYTISDGNGGTATASVTVDVAAVNDAPTLAGMIADQTIGSDGGAIDLGALTAGDIDGDATELELAAASGELPEGVSIVGGQIVVAPGTAAGSYELQIVASDGALQSTPVAFTLTVEEEPTEPVPFTQLVFQAEDGALTVLDSDGNVNDTTVRDESNKETGNSPQHLNNLRPGFSGTGYLDFGDTPGDNVAFDFEAPEAGTYQLHIRYATTTSRPLSLILDGGAPQSVAFAPTGVTAEGPTSGFNNWGVQTVTLTLAAGSHSFAFAIPAGATTGPNLDSFVLTAAGETPVFPAPNQAVPVISTDAFSVVEGDVSVGVIAATDHGTTLSYALADTPGNDNALFTIDPATGELAFVSAPDFENPVGGDNSYQVVVSVFDGALTTTKTITVTVTDDPSDNAPVDPVDTTADEGGDLVLSVVDVSDPESAVFAIAGDDADIVSYQVSVNGGAAVTVTPVGGQFTLDLGGLEPGEVSLTLTVTDEAGNVATAGATAIIEEGNEAPQIVSAPAFSVAENATAVGSVTASDADSDTLTYTLTGADADKLSIDASGVITLNDAADFETAVDADGDGVYEATVTVSDGTTSTTQDITVTVTDVNEAPSGMTLSGDASFAENAAAGTVVGVVSVSDPDAGDTVTYTVDDPRFVVNSLGQLAVANGASFDFDSEPALAVTVTATDSGGLSVSQSFDLAVEGVTDPGEPGETTGMLFDLSTLTSYSTQDRGAGASVSDDGATLTLDGNLWKRAPLGESFTITDGTKITLQVTLGSTLSEIIAIGFDDDNSPFEMSDRSVYQIAGTEAQGAFIDLRNGNAGTPGSTFTVTIDLSAHAGKSIDSLVFIADDDFSGNGIGSVSFSNVQITQEPDVNAAPIVVGGGIADLVIDERSDIEIDLPFVDPDGDAISYTVTVTDADGNPVAGFEDLTIVQGTLSGTIAAAPSTTPYTVTVTADDGQGGVTSTDFQVTVENINDAPVLSDAVAPEPYFGTVGEELQGIDIGRFADAFVDPDGDPLTLTVEGLPAGLSLNSEGVIVGTPLEVGSGSFTIVATDPGGLRSELEIDFVIDGPTVGDTTVVEAEAFTGLGDADAFYASAAPGASGNQIIRTNANQSASVTTQLSSNGVSEGWYEVSITVMDETDGTATFSLMIGDTVLAEGLSFDEAGSFDNPGQIRGSGGQVGNLKTITFTTPVFIDAETLATLTGQSDSGEYLRIDKMTFTRVEQPDLPPADIALDTASVAENAAGAVIGTLTATDPDGDSTTIVYTTDDERFVIVDGQLQLAEGVSLDFEAGETVTVSVTATDATGLSTTSDLTVTVGDVNEAPVLAEGATIEDVTLEAGETQSIDLAAALGATDPDAGDVPAYIAELAGGAALPDGMSVVGGVLEIGATVAAGTYEIVVSASDGELDSESVSFTVTVGEPGEEPPFQPVTIQAEAGTITSNDPGNNDTVTTVRDPSNPESNPDLQPSGLRPDFTGSGYVDFGDTAGDTVSYSVSVPSAGTYTFEIRYASNTDRPLNFAVNGGAATLLPFLSTDPDGTGVEEGFDNWLVQTVTVELQAGENSFSLAIPAGATTGPNIDAITISQPDSGDTSADADEIPLFLSGPQDPLNDTEAASINFNLAGIDADIVTVQISFDGGATRTEVFPDADGDFTADGSALGSGDYTAVVYVTDEAGNEASSSMELTVEGGGIVVEPFTIQAEDTGLVSVDDTGTGDSDTSLTRAVSADRPDASGNYRAGAVGGSYIDFGSNPGDAIVFNVDAPAAGTYLVTFRYANGGTTDRPMDLILNDGAPASVSFVPGPVVGTGPTATAWESWIEQTVEVTLTEGANTIRLEMPAGSVGGPNIDQASFEYLDGTNPPVEPFELVVEAETFTPIDDTGTGAAITQARTADNPEDRTDLPRDTNGDGLWDGFTGDGYLDMGSNVGDAASFSVDVPDAGTYTLTFRYSNGGGGTNGDRPMTLTIGGETVTVSFPGTSVEGWDNWQTVSIDVELEAGSNTLTIANTIANGPNIDNVTISREGDPVDPVDPREQVYFEEVVKINFQPAPGQTTQGLPSGYVTPSGYLADTGLGFAERGNGFAYGWVTEASVADGTENGTTASNQPANAHWYKNTVTDASDLQKTYAHFEYPGAGAGGSRAWEMALEDGTYQVTMSVGDTAGAFDSNYVINVEGQSFMNGWTPANPVDGSTAGGGFRSTLVTGMVTVTDGRLTIDSIGGVNTEIQYLEIERVPDLTPDDDRPADLDYSFFAAPVAASQEDGQVSIAIGPNGELPTDIDPTSSFVVGVNLQADGNRGPNISYVENIKLVETLTGEEVAINVQISGGADSLTIRPLQQLKENTSYTLKVEDVLDLGSVTDPNGELRQFQDLTTTFVTGEAPEDVPREVAFTTDTLLDGFGDGAFGYTTIEFGPDGKLYVGTITGEIHRWDVNSDGTVDKASQETLSLDYLDTPTDRRGIVGFVFDPEDPNTIWITDNAPIPRESKAFNTPEFSGRVSKITLGEGGSFEDASAETYISGLPRSGGDHLTNSLEFRANPNAGEPGEPDHLLYLTQGSNSAAGAADNAWGNRPERLLNAAILEIDPRKDAPAGGFDVRTEPIDADDNPTTSFPASQFNEDGTYPGMYNPYAEDAVLKIFATGVRNAYDLVWHSNGNLYVPTNGTASGGKTPQDPTQPGLDTVISNSPKQYDYFFTVEEGGYYGHPVALRDEYILNGGNPTSGQDPNEVVGGNDGNPNTDGYQTGVDVDENYDFDGVYNLGYNQSPNGATEYTGNAFGSNLKGAILFAQFSTGDNVRVIRVNAAGEIIGDDVLRRPDGSIIDDYIDPLDIIENPITGQLYLMTLNRGTGASQLIMLTPAPGGVTQDLSANEGGDLVILPFDVSDPEAAIFQVNGLDDDITAIRVSFNGGPKTTIELDAQDRFTFDVSTLTGTVTVELEVTDDALNTATVDATFVPGEEPAGDNLISLVTIQAEDKTPGDGTAVTTATGVNAQIQIRDASNPETGTGVGYVNGLRPGAFGIDGNTDNTDGTPGGYADFGSTNADFLTFTFDVPEENAGSAVLKFRYSNGGDADRPLQLEVNGTIVTVQSFAPTGGGTVDGWTQWAIVEVPVSLLGGQNTVTLRSVAATGPNIDQLEVMVPETTDPVPNDGEEIVDGVTYVVYEAENADFGGAAVVTEDRDQSGEFVDFVGTADQSISWTVSVEDAGTYALDILYALANTKAGRPMTLAINGVAVETLAFAPNSNAGETVWGPQNALVDLLAGENTITVTAPGGNGPNVDYLRVTKEPVSVFEPDYADISGSGRIELEAADGSANTVNGSVVDFYFTVDADGIYKLDTAANANATNGQGLTWFLNGVEIDETTFPGIGTAGEESIYIQLAAGTQYQLRVVSDAPGANGIDYLDVQPAPGNANADIAVQSLDAAYLSDRLHFSYLENPDAVAPGSPRDFKDSGTVRISNTGTEPLEVLEADLTGPFALANPSIFEGLTLAPGQSIDVEVLFDRAAYTPPTSNVNGTSTIFTGELEIRTNDADSPIATIDLAGFWQLRDEGGQEPNVNEIWKIFGFGNQIPGLTLQGGGENSVLSTNDVFAKTHSTEVLSPYWRIADDFTEAKITQLAAFHGPGGATMGIHAPKVLSSPDGEPIQNAGLGQNINFWNHEGNDNQRLLPNAGNDSTFATRTFTNSDIPDGWLGNEVFGISVAGLSSDPRLNPRGNVLVEGAQQGHTVKIFQALDADGNVIPNVYLGVMDYTGINYDYNDNLFVIEGVTPVGFGQELAVEGLDDAAADDRLVFTNIDQPANAQQVFRNEATFTISNDGFAPLSIAEIVLSNEDFEIVGTAPTSIPAGGSVEVTVRFTGDHTGTSAGAELITGTLTIASDAGTGDQVIQLAGLAQEFSENGSEPTVAQIVEAFGYSTDMAQGELAGGGVVETIGDEVLMPYMQRLDGSKPVEVIQLAAFLQQNNVARLGFHGLEAGEVTNLFAQDDQEYQTVLPSGNVPGNGAAGGVARGQINQAGPFGLFISVDGRPTYASWSDPEANKIDPDFGQLVGDNQGHLIRFFQALDADGNAIEGTFIAIQDYPGAGNYDYNDHMFVIKNVQPYELAADDDADGDGVNDALQLDGDDDGTVDFFDPDTDPVDPDDGQQPYGGTAPGFVNGVLTVDASNFDTGGQGVAHNDNAGKDGGTGFRPGEGVEFVGSENDIGHVKPGEWVEYTIDVPASGNYSFSVNAKTPVTGATVTVSLADGTPLGTVTLADGHAGGASFGSAAFAQSGEINFNLPGGEQTLRLTFNGPLASNGYVLDLRSFTLETNSLQTPFGGTAPSFTAGQLTVDASNFDNGGLGVAYNDNAGKDGGTGFRPGESVEFVGAENDIGHVKPGEWVEYTINVPAGGSYAFSVNAKTPVSGATVAVSLGDGAPLGTLTLADGHAGGSNFASAAFAQSGEIDIALPSGQQTIRLTFDGPLAANGYVLDLRSFTLEANGLQTPFGGTAPVLDGDGLTIDGIDYDNGGQGVAYNDAGGLQGGTNGGRAGSAVEATSSGDIGWIASGEWLEYTIDVEEAGFYEFNLSMSLGEAGGPNRSVTASFTNGSDVETVTVATPRTGTWSNFQDTQTVAVDLEEGTTVVRLTFNGGSQDLSSFSLTPVPGVQLFSASAAMSHLNADPLFDATQFASVDDAAPAGDQIDTATDDDHGQAGMGHVFGYDMMT